MNDLSLHILDVAQNSVAAGATRISIKLSDDACGIRRLSIADNGCGMSAEVLAQATSPFFTSRTTRRIGLGIPLLKMAAEMTGGFLTLESEEGKGTVLTACFDLSHIDCPPLGDIGSTVMLLVQGSPDIQFVYHRQTPHSVFLLDTDTLRGEQNGIQPYYPKNLAFIARLVNINEKEHVEVHQ